MKMRSESVILCVRRRAKFCNINGLAECQCGVVTAEDIYILDISATFCKYNFEMYVYVLIIM